MRRYHLPTKVSLLVAGPVNVTRFVLPFSAFEPAPTYRHGTCPPEKRYAGKDSPCKSLPFRSHVCGQSEETAGEKWPNATTSG